MLSLVVTVVLLGLAASDPTPPKGRKYGYHDPYPGPQHRFRGIQHPILPGPVQTKILTAPKVHREQVGLIQQQAVAVPQTKVVTNERVKVVTQTKPVLIPQTKVQNIIKEVPLQVVKKVRHPVVVKHKEMVPIIKERVKNIVRNVPKVITNTVVKNVPHVIQVPKIKTNHVHHVRTQLVPKEIHVPKRVDNYVKVPHPIIKEKHTLVPQKVRVVEPKYIDRVHVRTQTKFVDRPLIKTVVKPKVMVKTEYKTIKEHVPVPKHFHHTRLVDRPVPKIQTVVQKQLVPQVYERTHVKKVHVPLVKTQTVVKHQPVDRPVPKIINHIQQVPNPVPAPYKQTVVKTQKIPIVQTQVVEKIRNHVQQVPIIKNHVKTVHKTHIKEVPRIVEKVVPQLHIQRVIVPKTQVIVKETHKEAVQPVQLMHKQTVRYYRIDHNGNRHAITPAYVQQLISRGDISRSDIQTISGGVLAGGTRIVGGAAGLRHRAGRRHHRLSHGRYAAQGTSVHGAGQIGVIPQHIGAQQIGGVVAGLHGGVAAIGGATGGQIGTLNIAATGAAGAQQAALHAEAAMLNNAARQASISGAGGFHQQSRFAGMLKNLNGMSSEHILAKVAKK